MDPLKAATEEFNKAVASVHAELDLIESNKSAARRVRKNLGALIKAVKDLRNASVDHDKKGADAAV